MSMPSVVMRGIEIDQVTAEHALLPFFSSAALRLGAVALAV